MDDSRLGGANYRKALIVCQRMERAPPFCQVRDSTHALINPEGGMWLAHSHELRNDFVRMIPRVSIEAGTEICRM
jgi:hypothetical protein